jgi:hypothetical protein
MKLIKSSIAILLAVASIATAAPPDANPRLGMNLAGPADWMTELPFVDVFRTARPWISQKKGAGWGQGPELAVDEFGWVKQLEPGCYAEAMLCTISGGHYPAGTYTVLYEGEGGLDFGKNAKIKTREPGRILIDVDSSKGGFSLQILDHFEKTAFTDSSERMRRAKAIADKYGVKLIAYEGGQHMVAFVKDQALVKQLSATMHACNRHPRMGEMYRRYYDEWAQIGGDVFAVFSSIGRYSNHGAWGLAEYYDSRPADYPKLEATLRWAKNHGQAVEAD